MRILLIFLICSSSLSAQNWLHLEPETGSDSLRAALGVQMVNVYKILPQEATSEDGEGHVVRIVKHPDQAIDYDRNGRPTAIVYYNSDEGLKNKAIAHTYNAAGQLVGTREATYGKVSVGGKVESKVLVTNQLRYRYDDRGRRTARYEVMVDKETQATGDSTHFEWDEQDRLLRRRQFLSFNRAGEVYTEVYDHDGRTTTVRQEMKLEGESREVEVEWDENGRMLRKITRLPKGTTWDNQFEYRKGRLYKVLHYRGSTEGDRRLDYEEELFYNKQGLLVMRQYRGGGSEVDGVEELYEYFFYGKDPQ